MRVQVLPTALLEDAPALKAFLEHVGAENFRVLREDHPATGCTEIELLPASELFPDVVAKEIWENIVKMYARMLPTRRRSPEPASASSAHDARYS